MEKKLLRDWKKVFEADLKYISFEVKEMCKVPSMIFLEGPLGAGKTTFAKSFADDNEILSPTYSILSETSKIVHADFYRFESSDEIYFLEIPLYLKNKSYFLAEWGSKYAKALFNELPETFSFYLLEISPLNDATSESHANLRNFSFYEVSEF